MVFLALVMVKIQLHSFGFQFEMHGKQFEYIMQTHAAGCVSSKRMSQCRATVCVSGMLKQLMY